MGALHHLVAGTACCHAKRGDQEVPGTIGTFVVAFDVRTQDEWVAMLTAHHVAERAACECTAHLVQATSDTGNVDVAAIAMQQRWLNERQRLATNLVALTDSEPDEPRSSTTCYKIGAMTGFTLGTYRGILKLQVLENDRPINHGQQCNVFDWTHGKLAVPGDSGALYFCWDAKRGTFTPDAIHIGSGRLHGSAVSFGVPVNILQWPADWEISFDLEDLVISPSGRQQSLQDIGASV